MRSRKTGTADRRSYWRLHALLLILAFCLGYFVHRQGVIPFSVRENINNLLHGKPSEGQPLQHSSLTAGDTGQIVRDLKGIGYLGGYNPAPETIGVTVYDASSVSDGYNLYCSGHAPEAILMDMQGNVVHQWSYRSYPSEQAGFNTDNPDDREAGLKEIWRRVHLLKGGRLLAIIGVSGEEQIGGLICVDRNSQRLWSYSGWCHHDLDVDESGNIYVLSRETREVAEIDAGRPIIDDLIVRLDPDGEEIDRFSVLDSLRKSKYSPEIGHITPSPSGEIFHTNTLEILRGTPSSEDPCFRPGNLLISLNYLDLIAVVDTEKKEMVWALSGMWRRQHQPSLLDNGNLLLFDNRRYDDEQTRVIEFNPYTQEIVWSYGSAKNEFFYTATLGSCQRLADGNTVIVDSENGRAFEVTTDNEVVWEFYNPHRVGDEDEMIATLFDLVRLEPDPSLNWLGAG